MKATNQTPKMIANQIRQYLKAGDDSYKHVKCSQSRDTIVIDNLNNVYAIDVAKMACPNVAFVHLTPSMIKIAEDQGQAISATMTPTFLRSQFKDAYYAIGDKQSSLEDILTNMAASDARTELHCVINMLNGVQDRLKKWADQRLPNWD
jgi:gluconate kinase